jgi:apolipoprotein N-acyltransferase
MTALKLIQKNPYHVVELLLLIAGFLLAFSFAPYELFWLQFPLLAGVFLAVLNQTPKRAFMRGLLFGFGWFAHGIHWIFYSLYYHGGSPVFLAVLIIVLLALYMSLFPALALYFSNKFIKTDAALMLLVVYPLSWMLLDWLRGWFLTGFPWMQPGVAHIDSYLSGFAPLIGGLGVGLLVTIIAGLLALMVCQKRFKLPVVFIVVIYLGGFLLGLINWTQPVDEPVKVSLIQGNIPQSEKWRREMYVPTLQMYRQLTLENLDSDLIVWPETAVPGFKYRIDDYLNDITEKLEATHTQLLLGVFERDQQTQRYYNSVISLDGQSYKKRHLVPLGEYFPLRPVLSFFAQWIDIPMSDLDSGNQTQALISVAGQKAGISICFEDAFDRGVLRDLPEATLLINVSNDAWFEDSPEPWQHHQIARMRAAETGRSLLRVTNTGVSSVIGAKGEVLAILPQFRRDVLRYEVQAYSGATPYVIWANYLLILTGLGVWGWLFKKSLSVNKPAI